MENVEVKIRSIKTALEGVDFRGANPSIVDFYNILLVIEFQLNDNPVGLRAKEHQIISLGPHRTKRSIPSDLDKHFRNMKPIEDSLYKFSDA